MELFELRGIFTLKPFPVLFPLPIEFSDNWKRYFYARNRRGSLQDKMPKQYRKGQEGDTHHEIKLHSDEEATTCSIKQRKNSITSLILPLP